MTGSAPIRVLHVIDAFASDFFETLSRHVGPDVQVSICALGRPAPAAVDRLRATGVTVHVVDAPRLARIATVRAIADVVRREDPAVVHAHMTTPALLALPVSLRRRRVLSRHHGTSHHGPRRLHRRLADLGVALAQHRVVVASRWLLEVVRGEGVPRSRLVLISFGTDATSVTPAELDGERPVVVAAGRLHPEKGFDVLLAAVARLRAAGAAPTVLVAGDGPARGALEAEIAASGLGDVVRLLGHHHEVDRLFAAADLVVVPSRSETFGQVAMEAVLAGAPVVAAAVGALPELLEGLTGHRLVPPEDPAALADAMRSMLADPAATRAAAAASRPAACRRWDAATMGARYADLYRELARG